MDKNHGETLENSSDGRRIAGHLHYDESTNEIGCNLAALGARQLQTSLSAVGSCASFWDQEPQPQCKSQKLLSTESKTRIIIVDDSSHYHSHPSTFQESTLIMAKKEPKTEDKPAIPAGMKKRKDLPSVAFLLKHGDPETAHIPTSWAQIIGYPLVLALTFALSLFVFHNAPWDKMPAHKPYTLPKIKKVSHLEKKMHEKRIPHLNKDSNAEL